MLTGNLPILIFKILRATASCGEERHYFCKSEPPLAFATGERFFFYLYSDGHVAQVGYGGTQSKHSNLKQTSLDWKQALTMTFTVRGLFTDLLPQPSYIDYRLQSRILKGLSYSFTTKCVPSVFAIGTQTQAPFPLLGQTVLSTVLSDIPLTFLLDIYQLLFIYGAWGIIQNHSSSDFTLEIMSGQCLL